MADRIYVTYTPTTVPGCYHTTVHYERRDTTGNVVRHVTIEGQPERVEKMSAAEKVDGVAKEVFRRDDGPSRFGRIDAHVLDRKPDEVPDAPYEVIAEGDDLSANLARMRLFAHAVNGAGFAYRGDRQNSNSFAGAALRAGELPPATGVAHDPAGPPGELLEFFAPNGRFGNWASVPVGEPGDTRSPVLRALEKYRTSAAPDGPVSTSAQGLPATFAFRPAGAGGVLGKFVEDGVITPAGTVSSLPALPGPTAPNFANEESAFDGGSGNAPGGLRPATYPQLRRVSSAFPNVTPRDPEQLGTTPEAAPLLVIFSGESILPLPQRYRVCRIDPAHLATAPCPISWPALSGEIQQRFRRMTTRADLIATVRRRPGFSKGSARRGSITAFQMVSSEPKPHLLLSRHLTRRANHRHIFVIARIQKPAPGTGRGLFQSRLRLAALAHVSAQNILKSLAIGNGEVHKIMVGSINPSPGSAGILTRLDVGRLWSREWLPWCRGDRQALKHFG